MAKPTRVPGMGPQTTLRDAAPRLLQARLADARRYEHLLADALPEDPVHDMRVACRRLATALRFFDEEKLARAAKSLQDALGAVRDVHVQLQWLGGAAAADEPRVELGRAEAALRAALTTWKPAADHIEVAVLFAGERDETLGGKRPRRVLRRRLRSVDRRLVALDDPPEATAAHELRIRVKKLRYLIELLEPGFPAAAEVLLAMLTPLQDALGDLHDADVRLERFASDAQLAARALEERARHAQRVIQLARAWREQDTTTAVAALL